MCLWVHVSTCSVYVTSGWIVKEYPWLRAGDCSIILSWEFWSRRADKACWHCGQRATTGALGFFKSSCLVQMKNPYDLLDIESPLQAKNTCDCLTLRFTGPQCETAIPIKYKLMAPVASPSNDICKLFSGAHCLIVNGARTRELEGALQKETQGELSLWRKLPVKERKIHFVTPGSWGGPSVWIARSILPHTGENGASLEIIHICTQCVTCHAIS